MGRQQGFWVTSTTLPPPPSKKGKNGNTEVWRDHLSKKLNFQTCANLGVWETLIEEVVTSLGGRTLQHDRTL